MGQKEKIETFLRDRGTLHFGWAILERPLSMNLYDHWLKSSFHGTMGYLAAHRDQKADPTRLLKKAKTALVIGYPYFPHPYPTEGHGKLRVAKYAGGKDYHLWVKEDLARIRLFLLQNFSDDEFLCYVDSSPVLERDLAARAGLGWIGKNACLIDQKRGSFFFISEIYTTLSIGVELSVPADRCGTCTRCLDACPTGALVAPRVLDSNKCISYLTIENKSDPPEELRSKMNDWFYGCDICQDVCPWNQKIFGETLQESSKGPSSAELEKVQLLQEIHWILTASGKAIESHFRGSPILRARSWMLRRNAMIVAANLGLEECLPWIQRWRTSERLGTVARWVEKKLTAPLPPDST